MRILIFNFEYPPLGGGGGVATKQFAEELAKRHEVHVITTLPQPQLLQGTKLKRGLVKFARERGVYVHRVSVVGRSKLPTASLTSMVTFVPAALWKGMQLCRQEKFDVINAQFVIPSGIPAAWVAKWFQIPFVLSFIGGDLFDPSKGVSPHRHPLLRAVVRFVSRQATICTAISEDTKKRAQELHGVNRSITVTRLGLIPSHVLRLPRSALGLPEQALVFVTVGRLIPRKGYAVLLAAWREISGAHLVILGDGPLQRPLAQLIKEYHLSDRVHLLGFVDEEKKQQILRAADAYVSASEHEGFGIVFLEAMEAGLAIVSTDIGGQRDFLTEGENAILVPVHDSKQLAAGIRRLIQDQNLRQRMSANNREKVKEFHLEKVVKTFEEVLVGAAGEAEKVSRIKY